ncbi:hypothetical protein RJ80_gp23 [Vibrio phage phi-A318]|nr:hypothetical protein RJ80_gp23 [Vibrio phage phi-A318]AGZ17750.1 hypothetical protein [Vibrio phage phi-A318]
MRKVVILNAPPFCGKDTIANLLKEKGFAVTEFKFTMFNIAIAMSGMSKESFMREYNDREQKEKPQEHLGGLSYREFMIHISEDIMKPLFGEDVFGKRAAEACTLAHDSGFDVVFSDGGFIDEVKALNDAGLNVTVIRLHRDGYTYGNDSRRYLYPDFCRSFDITLQEGLPSLAVSEILERLQ